jgi:hypothetical protein
MDGGNYPGSFCQEKDVKKYSFLIIKPGNQPPQLTENLLTKGVVLEFVKFDNKQKLMYIMSK